ncbi:antitoxin [Streptomyces sp. CC224B]|uniref:antitoxin n=1 Tax=Streptomyces sp. CC224B TaxID=3044571 RepID=UPI0024A9885F|nr:antitoxin [Streptomyces sp. CC224B]
MGFLDNLKAKLRPAKGKASALARRHGDTIDQGLEKAAKVVDRKTKGKYSSQIASGTGKAKDALGRLAGTDGGKAGGGDTAPPAAPPPPSSPRPPSAS